MPLVVAGIPPQNWRSPLVDSLRRTVSAPAPRPVAAEPARFEVLAMLDSAWREIRLDCPFDGNAVEGYTLTVAVPKDAAAPLWLDTLRFEPVWAR